MDIDRTGDEVFSNTTNVVKAVMEMVNMVHAVKSDQYVNLVRVSSHSHPYYPIPFPGIGLYQFEVKVKVKREKRLKSKLKLKALPFLSI